MGMDIHECFENKLERFNEAVKRINGKPNEDPNIPYVSQWEHFESFLSELISDDQSRFKEAILRLFFDDEELELHEKIKELFNFLVEYDDKTIISMIYDSNCDRVEVKFDKSGDMIHAE